VQPTAKVHKLATRAIQTRADGKAAELAPIIAELQAAGVTSFTGISAGLNQPGIATARGNRKWTTTQVIRLMARLE
jgi:hypothetical protein